MALDAEVTSLDGVDAAYHGLYTERDGKWLLTGINGYTPEDRQRSARALATERDNAKKYAGELKALKPWAAAFDGKTPDEIQTQLDRIEELEAAAAGKIDKTELEKMATARAEAAAKPLQRKLKELEDAGKEVASQLEAAAARVAAYERAEERAAIRSEIQRAALASGALPESYAEGGGLLAVLEGVLEVEVETDDEGRRKLGAVRSKDGAGYPSGLDAGKLLAQIQTKQGYFWGPSSGGGANAGNGGRGASGVANPWDPKTRNRTQQMEIFKRDPQKAKALAAVHGQTV